MEGFVSTDDVGFEDYRNSNMNVWEVAKNEKDGRQKFCNGNVAG